MLRIRQLLAAVLLCSTLAITCALAQSSLTQIRDLITNSDGTPFDGMVVITWNGYSVPSGTPVSQLSASATIYNGALSVLLVPTTTAAAGTYYTVVYSSSDGTVTWTETWQVPPSTTALTISQVRQSTTQGSGGTTTNPTGGGATLPIAINQVTGLGSDLSAINTAISTLNTEIAGLSTSLTTLTNTVNGLVTTVNGLTSNGSSEQFADAQVPGGVLNGANNTFSLANTPAPATSLALYRNGLAQTVGVDYTLAGSVITFTSVSVPQSTDLIQAFYRMPGTGSSTSNFVDAVTPSGAINGVNLVFTLASAPSPASSLKLYRNGLLLSQSGDYTISGTTITFASATTTPQTGDLLIASYRN